MPRLEGGDRMSRDARLQTLGRGILAVALVAIAAAAYRLPVYAAPAAHKELTVEAIFGSRALQGAQLRAPVWSPDGTLLTFFEAGAQGTELAAWDAKSGERRVLVTTAQLQEMRAGGPQRVSNATGLGRHPAPPYYWSPRGDAILFVSGGSLYLFDPQAGKSRQVLAGEAEVNDVKFSPDGKYASFLREHNLWVVELGTGKERQITRGGSERLREGELDWVYPEELELLTAYWWAPDSSAIAYLEMDESKVTQYPVVDYLELAAPVEMESYPQAGGANPVVRVGVVELGGGETPWMDTGSEKDVYLPRVTWMPDSKHLAIQRLNRAQNELDLLQADLATGKTTTLFEEKDKYWVNVTGEPIFVDGGKEFLWTSERDGFRHIYMYAADGTMLRQLTHGNWAVTEVVGVDEKAGVVYFMATEKTPLERQLYRVPLEGGEAQQVTREAGTHRIAMAPGAARFLDTFSTVLVPPKQFVIRPDGKQAAMLNQNHVAALAEYDLKKPEFGELAAADGSKLFTEMILPAGFTATKKYPVLVYIYGGPDVQQVTNSWSGRGLWLQMMAQKGYIIFTLDNRGSANRGHAFETPIYHQMGKTELKDQMAGVAYLQSLPYVDGTRIGITGWSYGGYMTCMAMFEAPEVFKAGFAGAPVTDWRQYDSIYTERYMGSPSENAEGYRESSPVTHAEGLRGKLLVAHATGDDNVHFANTLELLEALVHAGRYAEFAIYAGRGHGITDAAAQVQLWTRVTQFFLDNL
jgi:dipeptidyl-peptidase 4